MKEAEKEMAREYYKELLARENTVLAFVSCILATIPAILILYFLANEGRIPLLLMLLPGLIIGAAARLGGGRAFRVKVKIIPAVSAAVVMLVAWSFLGFSSIVAVMALPNAIVAYLLGKPVLTERQALAKHRIERGLVSL